MNRHLVAAGLMLSVLVSGVTAKVTRHARASLPDAAQYVSPTPTQWRPQFAVVSAGEHYTFLRHDGFETEDACKAFMTTDEFRGEHERFVVEALADDPAVSFEGEPECVAASAPSDPA